jgi:hypothetical protein
LILVVISTIVALGYFLRYYSISSSGIKRVPQNLLKGKLGGYDVRLFRYYLSTKKLSRDEIINLAKKDCHTLESAADTNTKYPPYFQYKRSLGEKLINRMGLSYHGR